jgi:hypothetical protein
MLLLLLVGVGVLLLLNMVGVEVLLLLFMKRVHAAGKQCRLHVL